MTEEKRDKQEVEFPSEFAVRRRMLMTGVGALCCAGAVEAGWPLFRYLSAREAGEAAPVILPKSKLPPGSVVEIVYGGAGAIVFHEGTGVYVLSKVCTHLGCIVTWKPDQRQFYCGCHKAHFDQEGRVLDGPPPRPLDRIPCKEEGDHYVIGVEPEAGKEGGKT